MAPRRLIYGATGFTGRLITAEARLVGLTPVLAGRDAAKLAAIADGLEYRVARLADADGLAAALAGIDVVLNVAGPFSHTAEPMVRACLRAGVHYLDVAGEAPVIEATAAHDAEARRRGIMVMPGVGFDVVPSDCLAAHVVRRLPGARRLALGLTGLAFATRGSAKTLTEHAGYGGINVRRGGVITPIVAGTLERTFDFGRGPRRALNVGWGDVASAWYTTGIPDIEVYFEATASLEGMVAANRWLGWLLRTPASQAWLKACADLLPEGPTPEDRAAHDMVLVAEVEDDDGRRASARLTTPEAYTMTAMTAPAPQQWQATDPECRGRPRLRSSEVAARRWPPRSSSRVRSIVAATRSPSTSSAGGSAARARRDAGRPTASRSTACTSGWASTRTPCG
jgi:short subunit dehydrogenase-like uncharacterized protein